MVVNQLSKNAIVKLPVPVPPVSVESQSLTATIMMLQTMDLVALLPRSMLEMATLKGCLVALDLKEHFRPNMLGLTYRSDRSLMRVGQVYATHARRAAAHLSRLGAADEQRQFMFARAVHQTPNMITQDKLLTYVAWEIDAGRIRTTKDKILALINVASLCEAHRLIETGAAKGKIVVQGQA